MILQKVNNNVSRNLLERLKPIVSTYSRNGYSGYENSRKHVLSAKPLLSSEVQNAIKQLHGYKFFATEVNVNVDYYPRTILQNSDRYAEFLSVSPLTSPMLTSTSVNDAKKLIDLNWESLSSEDIISNFEKISYYGHANNENLDDEKYNGMATAIEANCSQFSNEDLRQILRYLQLWTPQNIQSTNFKKIWMSVDKKLVEQIPQLPINEIYLTNDLYFKLTLCRKANFPWRSLRKIAVECRKLKTNTLIQFMFFYKTCPKLPVNIYEIEYLLEKNLDKYSIEEVGIVLRGFVKAQTAIKSWELLIRIMQKTVDELDTISDFALTSVSKIIRLTKDERTKVACSALLERLVPVMPKFSLNSATHIGHMMARLILSNNELIDCIIKKVEDDLQSATINDMERVVFTLSTFNYDPKKNPLYHKIIKELKDPHREEEIDQHRIAFCAILRYLSYANLYPVEHLCKAFSHEFVDKKGNDNSYSMPRDYFILDQSIQIELPDYNGPRLADKYRERLGRTYNKNFHKLKHGFHWLNTEQLNQVHDTCKEIIEPASAIKSVMILPHYHKNDLVIRMDQDNNFKDIGETFSEIPELSIKRIPENSNDRWIVFLMGTYSHLTKNSHEKIGLINTNIRQLQRLGYIPIMIPHNEWMELTSPECKINYIKNILHI